MKSEKMIEELKKNQSELELDLVASRLETKKCTKKLDEENLKWQKNNFSNEKLIFALEKNQTKLASELETYKSTDAHLAISQRKLKDCNAQLEDVVTDKHVIQKKYELVCPWSEWSSCSKTCWGTKRRTDKCSNSDEQMEACNQDSSCPRSGK